MILLKRLRVENFKLLRRLDLSLPRQGSVLIEGLNESGKSTLFESVYFALYGAPLVTEGRGKGSTEAAIRHGAESASVELWLEIDHVELEVQRVLKRGKPARASLVVRRPDAPEEKVSGVLSVNARVVEELGGLDGEALLNSCFVEQKRLSKLEDLAPSQRKDSLRKLLNLERLTDLADRFKPTLQDERALVAARDRLELAKVSAQLPFLVKRRAELEESLGTLSLRGTLSTEERESCLRRARQEMEEGHAPGEEWSLQVAALKSLRESSVAARRRGIALASGALVVGGIALAAAVGGAEAALLALPAVAPLMLLSVRAFGAARNAAEKAAEVESALSIRRDALVAKIGEMEGRRRSVERRLAVDGLDLDPDDCRAEMARLARQGEVNRRAAALLEGTMERIVRMVLPNTERNLGQILPVLTAGRYHEARIAEDYQIQVWDDSAGRYVSKSLFSGGARDQFSLALRLSFALATLPQELGTTPGFLFLDEPLSSFDGPRTEALVRLLTSGQVAASFPQIFVISHNRSFDAAAFRYRLTMRDGRIVESSLPEGGTREHGDAERRGRSVTGWTG